MLYALHDFMYVGYDARARGLVVLGEAWFAAGAVVTIIFLRFSIASPCISINTSVEGIRTYREPPWKYIRRLIWSVVYETLYVPRVPHIPSRSLYD